MKAQQPNVIVIVSDDLGFADVGFNGASDIPTPHLDRLAASGVRFTEGYVTHPYCSPSRAGLLTGRYQQRFGHENNPPYAPEDETIGLPLDETLLSKVMKEAGYATGAVGKWHLGDAPRYLPTNRGFDTFFGFSGGGFNYYGRGGEDRHILRNGDPVPASEITYLTDDFTREAVRFIRQRRDEPFFLYLAYNAVHAPNQAPRRYLKQTRHIQDAFRTVYGAMTVAMDEGIGEVVRTLNKQGIRGNTLLFFVNDNGGRLGSDNRPLRGHKGKLYEGGVRVPFLASWPGHLPEGATYDEPVSALDIYPTAAAAADAAPAHADRLDGVNLLPFLQGEKQFAPHDALYWRVSGGLGYAVRRGRYKLIKPAALEERQLFDLKLDPGERNNLAEEKPEVVRQLLARYRQWDAQLTSPLWQDPHPKNVEKEYQAVQDARRRALPPADDR